MNINEFLNLPYNERQLIVFDSEGSEIKTIWLSEPKNQDLLRSIALATMPGVAALLAEIMISRFKSGVVHYIPLRYAKEFKFGKESDPQVGMTYVGHPIESQRTHYYSLDKFHTEMHKQKYYELIRILEKMKVTRFTIEYGKGYKTNIGIDTNVSGKGLPAEGELMYERNKSGNLDYLWGEKGDGSKDKQVLPRKLIWYHQETEWKLAIPQIMDRKVNHIEFMYRYSDDFGIKFGANAGAKGIKLKAAIKKSDFMETEWKVIVDV